jgi:glycine/D-amino acid oxidase-like deaminating enzyme
MKIEDSQFEINSKKITFSFEGKKYEAYENETIVSALVRNQIKGFRVDKENKERGPYCNIGFCNDCLISVNETVTAKACITKLKDGDKVLKHQYRPKLRIEAEENSKNSVIVKTEIIILGAGPGGLNAAKEFSRNAIDYILIDEKDSIGGQYLKDVSSIYKNIDKKRLDPQYLQLSQFKNLLKNDDNRIFLNCKVWGVFKKGPAEFEICADQKGKDLRFITSKLIVATGSYEKPFYVNGWHLPNVMGTGAAQIFLKSHKVFPGKNVVICGNGPLNFQLASELYKKGLKIIAIAETGKSPFKNFLSSFMCLILSPLIFFKGVINYLSLLNQSSNILHEHVLKEIKDDNGKKTIILIDKKNNSKKINDIDVVCLNYGFYPNNDIARLLGLSGSFNKKKNYFELKKNLFGETSDENVYFVGEAARNVGAAVSLYEGQLAALNIINKITNRNNLVKIFFGKLNYYRSILFQHFLWKIFSKSISNVENINEETIICRCENVRFNQIKKFLSQDHIDSGLIKRITRLGMGRCQARYCSPALTELFQNKFDSDNFKDLMFAPQNPIQPVNIEQVANEKEEWYGYVADDLPKLFKTNLSKKKSFKHRVGIIGAGIMGVSAAYYLSKREKDLCLVDLKQPNSQASGSNAGSLHLQLLSYDFDPKNTEQKENLIKLLSVQKKATKKWKELESELKSDFEISTDGGLMLVENESDLKKLIKKVELEKLAGVDTQVIEFDQFHSKFPLISNKMKYAGYCPGEGKINPLLATNKIFESLASKNISSYLNDNIQAIEKTNFGFKIITSSSIIESEVLLCCAGSWSNQIANYLNLPLKVRSIPQQMIVTEPVEYQLKTLVAHIGRHLTLKQATNGNFIIGGGWTAESSKLTGHTHCKLDSLEGNAWVANRVIPSLGKIKIIRSWAAMSVDVGGYPLVGEHPMMKNFYVMVSSNGYTLGPVLGEIISKQILDNKSDFSFFEHSRIS